MELQDSRALAHALFGRCRDSLSAYKTLAPSVRKLRNLLEEVEDSVSGGDGVVAANEDGVNEQAVRCNAILVWLDLAMQQHRQHHSEPTQSAIANLRTAIDVACHQLSVAYESPSHTGGVPLKLATDSGSSAPLQTANSVSGSGRSDDTRKLSTTSSAWSLVRPESITSESTNEDLNATISPTLKLRSSEEKQVYSPASAASASSANVSRGTSAWASTFALDPLSVPIDQAMAFILSEDIPAPSDHSLPSSGGAKLSFRPEDSHADIPHYSQNDQMLAVIGMPGSATSASTVSLLHLQEVVQPAIGGGDEREAFLLRALSLQQPLKSTGSVTLDIQQDVAATITHNRSVSAGYAGGAAKAPSLNIISRDDNAQFSDTGDEHAESSTDFEDFVASAPQLPPRRAPPPPPAPRRNRLRNAPKSRYIIANLTPLDVETSEDSEDDLEPAPKPASSEHGDAAQSQPQPDAIPEVRIDGSACEEGDISLGAATLGAATEEDGDSPRPVVSSVSREATSHDHYPASDSMMHPEKEVLDLEAQTLIPKRNPPPLPKRPARYHSLRSAPAAPDRRSAPLTSTPESQLIDAPRYDNPLQTSKMTHTLKQHRSVGEALNSILTTGDESPGRWSWKRRLRSRSELDHTQMPVPPPPHLHSHSSLAQLIRDEAGAAVKARPTVVTVESAPQLLGSEDRPPPVPPRPRPLS
ncbi:hypothetical protein LTR91_001277 [Friedmanniomyces endolithicus]|uniref:Uncharacterized protein n=1 Tax=Friedmanniomyces endolithicus TaxID=329885 RepID=A0A4U0UHB4_9PEZI|nr:hypothetical protein LTS09_004811 [Friedmanniomyces endolithicus]KAK0272904.1 hypothetical protein LTR35_012574 [Friedmanniomyces endolithicus]KAK0283900.1 hypothetical protein LTS00_011564 [Friedmanniomyces endolithicus]KAK0320387.1 hypothetical protein LTR82_008501 [Friedmanniomyces endolithicus]KAK0929763.1 hypothetical protein LTR57_001619 [Friedmanniomyces endolithicus]